MPYLNSGTPFYQGTQFTTGQQALELIRDNLTSWTLLDDSIAGSQTLTMRGVADNGHSAQIQFAYSANNIEFRLDYNGNGLDSSEPLQLEFTPGENNRLSLTFENDHAIAFVRNKYTYSGAVYCGFPDRFDPNDQDAWLIVKIANGINDAIVARAAHDGTLYKRVGDDFLDADIFTSPNINGGYQGPWDFLAVANPYVNFLNTDRRNAGYAAQFGQVNRRNDRPVSTRFFLQEGRGSVTAYAGSGNNPQPLYNRGYLKSVLKGYGKVSQGKIELDSNGDRYMVTGSNGGQAIKVEDGTPPAVVAELPTIFRNDISFAVTDNAIAEIRNVLQNIGWTQVTSGDTFILMSATHTNTVNKCYFRFTKVSDTQLSIQGDLLGNGVALSTAIAFTFTTGTNKIFTSANSQAATISFNESGGLWLGFLKDDGVGKTADGLDQSPVWGLGLIKDGVQETYLVVDGAWINIANSFVISSTSLSSYPMINSDRLTTAATPLSTFSNSVSTNSAFNAQNGQVNGSTGQVELDFYAIVSGLGSQLSYGTTAEGLNNAPKLSYHGVVDLVADGGNSLTGGALTTTATGAQFRSVGGNSWNLARYA